MTVTKQQQLEWLATMWDIWPGINFNTVRMSSQIAGSYNYGMGYHTITRHEWQQERDKMQKQADQAVHPAAQDNSWHERGELPPVGCECEVFVNDENKWMHFEVIAICDGHVLGWCRESSCGFQSNEKSEFRPLRTEREKAIDALIEIILAGGYFTSRDGAASKIAERLYDAGYRKEKYK